MKCKKCEAELEEGVTLCPACGFDNSEEAAQEQTEPAAEETPVEETPAEEAAAEETTAEEEAVEEEPVEEASAEETPAEESEEAPAEEAPADETPAEAAPAEEAPQEQPNAKMGPGKIALLVVLGIAAIAVVVALIMGGLKGEENPDPTQPGADPTAAVETTEATIPADGNPDDVTCKGTYSVSDDQIADYADTVVATMGDAELTGDELQIYYWMQFYDFMDMYGNYVAGMGMNPVQGLDSQLSIDGKLTWQQFLLKGAIENWRNYTAMSLKAQEEGYEIDEDYRKFLDELPDNLLESAKGHGYETAEEMIQADMGKGATLDAYISYMETYYRGYTYYSDQLEKLELTDEMVDNYFTEHAEEYESKGLTKEERFVDVRHILLEPQGGTADEAGHKTFSDEEWEACRAEAQKVLDEFLAGEQTEERFAELAQQYSKDPGSVNNGGLYTDVYKGQMLKPFEEWSFDESRAAGDTGLVQSDFGYHVMYFVESRPAWIQSARGDLMADKGQEILEQVRDQYELNIDYSAIELGVVDMNMGK